MRATIRRRAAMRLTPGDSATVRMKFVPGLVGGLSAATVAPLISAPTAVVGTSAKYAKEDHVHPAGVTGASATFPMRDSSTAVNAGGLHRLALVAGTTYWQTNTAAPGDFTSAVNTFTVSPAGRFGLGSLGATSAGPIETSSVTTVS